MRLTTNFYLIFFALLGLSFSVHTAGRLDVPRNVRATDGWHTDKISISWNAVSGATHYQIFRATSANASSAQPISGWIAEPRFDDVQASANTTYYYYVKAAQSATGSNATALSADDAGWRKPSNDPIVQVSGQLQFGEVAIGQTASRQMEISNTGDGTLHIHSIECPEGFRPDWNSGDIAPGARQTVTIRFTPSNAQLYQGNIMAMCNAASGNHTLATNGLGIYPSLATPTGLTASDAGTNGSIAVSWQPVVGATHYRLYRNTVAETNTATPLGNWQASTSFSDATAQTGITYYYFVQASRSADGLAPSPFSIAEAGSRVAGTPIIEVEGNLNFGRVAVGSSASRQMYILNLGNAPLQVSQITYLNGFSGNWAGGTIAPGDSQTVTVTFAPVAAGELSRHVEVFSNATARDNRLQLTGTGFAATPSGLQASDGTFDNRVAIGWQPAAGATHYRLLRNTKADTIGATLIAPWQTATTFTDNTAIPGTIYHYFVQAAASGTGRLASNITHAEAGHRAATKILSASANFNFGTVAIGERKTLTVTLRNSGNAAVSISRIDLPAGYSADWATATLAPGASRDLSITFAPLQAIAYTGALALVSDASSSTISVQMSGSGLFEVQAITATDGTFSDKVAVSWTAIPLAVAYRVYRGTTNVASSAQGISNWVTGTSFEDKTCEAGVNYFYFVLPARTTDGRQPGSFSKAESGYRLLVSPQIQVNPRAIDFDSVVVGTTVSTSVTVRNTGNANLIVNSILLPEGARANWASGTLLPGQSQAINIQYTPTKEGLFIDELVFNTNADNPSEGQVAFAADAVAAPRVQVSFAPNPAKTFTRIKILHTQTGPLSIRLVNSTGIIVRQWSFNKDNYRFEKDLGLSGLQPGIYFMHVQMKGFSVTRRIQKE